MPDAGGRRTEVGAHPLSTGVRWAPSILSADFGSLAAETARVEAAGADLLHLDVMDGHFVPNLTIGPAVVGALRRHSHLPFDVHLMVTDPAAFVGPFRTAGADRLTFHIEAVEDPQALAVHIRRLGARPGLALNPATPLEAVVPHLAAFDLCLVMTVHPGFGGQSFREDQLAKLEALARTKRQAGLDLDIQVDGGINLETARQAVEAGAEILVAGSAVFGEGDSGANLEALRASAV